ncbi:hypothetical protein ACFX1X_012679 [Malus domestica]
MKVNSNAMRSGVVVLGALAFGYLTLQLGFRPFLERAQSAVDDFDPACTALRNCVSLLNDGIAVSSRAPKGIELNLISWNYYC